MINLSHKVILIKLYFDICKTVYIIRSRVAYAFANGTTSNLVQDQSGLIEFVKNNLVNLFERTEPYHMTIGDKSGVKDVSFVQKKNVSKINERKQIAGKKQGLKGSPRHR